MKEDISCNNKKAVVTIVTSENLRQLSVARDKKGYYIMIKWSVYQNV